jgi:hypothetical protein
MAATKLIAPNGAKVSVDSGRVENLLRRGFTKASEPKKAPAKKAASRKTASDSDN